MKLLYKLDQAIYTSKGSVLKDWSSSFMTFYSNRIAKAAQILAIIFSLRSNFFSTVKGPLGSKELGSYILCDHIIYHYTWGTFKSIRRGY